MKATYKSNDSLFKDRKEIQKQIFHLKTLIFIFLLSTPMICSAQILQKYNGYYLYGEQLITEEGLPSLLSSSQMATFYYNKGISAGESAKTLGMITSVIGGLTVVFYYKTKNSRSIIDVTTGFTGLLGSFTATFALGIITLHKASDASSNKIKAINQFNLEKGTIGRAQDTGPKLDLALTTNGLGLVYNF